MLIPHNPEDVFPPYRCDSHAVEIQGGARLPLGSHRPAGTVVCCQLLDPRWKLEVEAVAAR